MQEAIRLLLGFFKLDVVRRLGGESTKEWTRGFGPAVSKIGKARHAASAYSEGQFVRLMSKGILPGGTSGCSPNQFAPVLAISGAAGAEGGQICSGCKFNDLVEVLCNHWGRRGFARWDCRARRAETVVAVMGAFGISALAGQ